MNRVWALVAFFVFCFISSPAIAQGPDVRYVSIYNLIQSADQLWATGSLDAAREKYQEAKEELTRLRAGYPEWNANVVEFRLNYVEERLGTPARSAAPQTPASAPRQPEEKVSRSPDSLAARPDPRVAELDQQVRELVGALERATGDNRILEEKLKEALAAQPAAGDPRELAKADQKIRELEKQLDLVRAELREAARPGDRTNRLEQLEMRNQELLRQVQETQAAAGETARLKQELNALQAARQEAEGVSARLAAAESTLQASQATNEVLRAALSRANERLAVMEKQPAPADAARVENLTRELAAAKDSARTNSMAAQFLQQELQGAQSRIQQLQGAQAAAVDRDKETERLRRQAASAKEAADAAQARVKQMEQQMADASRAGVENQAPVADWQRERSALLQEKAALSAELDKARQPVVIPASLNESQAVEQLRRELETANQMLMVRGKIIAALKRDKDLLEAQLEGGSATDAARSAGSGEARSKLAEMEAAVAAQREIANAARAELGSVRAAAEQARSEAARLRTALDELGAANAQQVKERLELENQLSSGVAGQQRLSALEAENSELKRAVQAAQERAKQIPDEQGEVEQLRAQKTALEFERAELQRKLSESVEAREKASAADASSVRLAQEKEALQMRVDALQQQLAGIVREKESRASAPATPPERGAADRDLAGLRAKLAVYEAQKVPYTPAEMALMQAPAKAQPSGEAKSSERNITKLPPGAGTLVSEAQQAFAAGRLEDAERAYAQLLKLDEENVFTLSNLAAIQIEQGKLPEAEKNLRKALARDAEDAYSLSLLGIVKFQEAKYDEALEALSRAAQADPQNAETQNYLGITLSQKGMRAPAEAALRRAIQLAPGYANAHHNLAVIYATQKPPFKELARWHYQQALDKGHARHAELEKLIAE